MRERLGRTMPANLPCLFCHRGITPAGFGRSIGNEEIDSNRRAVPSPFNGERAERARTRVDLELVMDGLILLGGLIGFMALGLAALGWGADTSPVGECGTVRPLNAENTP